MIIILELKQRGRIKVTGFDWQNNNSACYFHVLWMTGTKDNDFLLFLSDIVFSYVYSPLEFNSWKIRQPMTTRRVGIRAMKFETAWILFLGEVFAAVAVFVAYGRWYQGKELNRRWSSPWFSRHPLLRSNTLRSRTKAHKSHTTHFTSWKRLWWSNWTSVAQNIN